MVNTKVIRIAYKPKVAAKSLNIVYAPRVSEKGWYKDSPNPHTVLLRGDRHHIVLKADEKDSSGKWFTRVFAGPVPLHEDGYLYHVTTSDRLAAIAKKGLQPSGQPRFGNETGRYVYLSTNPKAAVGWGYKIADGEYHKTFNSRDGGRVPKMALLRVHSDNVRSSDKGKQYRPDEMRTKSVAAEHLEQWRKDKWRKL